MRLWTILLLLLGGCVTEPPPAPSGGKGDAGGSPVVDCGRLAFHAVMREKQATLYLPGIALSLSRTPSESGVRYAANNHVLRRTAGNISFSTPQQRFPQCTLGHHYNAWANAWLRGVDFRALGDEPGWILEISKGRTINLQWQYGRRQLAAPVPPVSRQQELYSYRTATDEHRLVIEVMDRPCRDSMKGDPHDYAVRVRVDDTILLGCGRGRMPVESAP